MSDCDNAPHGLGRAIKVTALALILAFILMTVGTIGSDEDVDALDANGNPVVTSSITHGTVANYTYSPVGQGGQWDVDITITASTGYVVPEDADFTVYMGNTRVTYEYSTSSSRSIAYLYIDGVTQDLEVTGSCVEMASVTIRVTAGSTTSTSSDEVPGIAYSERLPSRTGYDYPSSVTITRNGSTMSSSGYTYSSSTGYVTINASQMTEGASITISATYVAETYSVTGSVTHGSLDYTGTPTYGQSYTINIDPDNGYDYPDRVTVTMNGSTTTNYSYNSETGTIRINSVTGAISVTATCGAATYSITYHDGNSTLSLNPNRYTYGVGCTLPTNVEKENYIFVGWRTADGADIESISRTTYGDVDLYAVFIDDLSNENLGGTQMMYYIVAVLAIVGMVGVAYISRK